MEKERMNGQKIGKDRNMPKNKDIWATQEFLKRRFQESLDLRNGRTVKELVREANKGSRAKR